MNNSNTLEDYYRYWDKFVYEWSRSHQMGKCSTRINGWSAPNTIENSDNLNDGTIQYLPEPWWGNDGTHELSSIIINYNPYSGGDDQKFNSVEQSFKKFNYRNFIKNNVSFYIKSRYNNSNKIGAPTPFLETTCDWHYKNRCKPIIDTLNILGNNVSYNLRNHLSIELIPWHSKGVNKDVTAYAHTNADMIFNHCIKFAAEASRCIHPDYLRRIVFVRIPHDKFVHIFKKFQIEILIEKANTINGDILDYSHISVIRFSDRFIDDVKFILIWMPDRFSSNNFPHCLDLIKIMKHIPTIKSIT